MRALACLIVLAACGRAPQDTVAPSPVLPDAQAAPDLVAEEPSLPEGAVTAVVDQQVAAAMLSVIEGATETLDVLHFELIETGSVVAVRQALLDAAARGVAVRVLLDNEVESNVAKAAALAQEGIDARVDGPALRVHLKLLVADDAVVLVGSTNLSGASLDYNHEANVLIREPEVAAWFAAYADAVWADPTTRPALSPVTTHGGALAAWGDAGYLDAALPRIEAASERIDLVLYGINLDPKYPDGPVQRLADALYAAAARGVAVRVLLEHSDWNPGLNDLNQRAREAFEAQGITVRFDPDHVVTHAKVLLVDDAALVATNNWGFGGLALDHEAGVATTAPEPVAQLSGWFNRLWADAR